MKTHFCFSMVCRLAIVAGGFLLAISGEAFAQSYLRGISPYGNYGPYITRPYYSSIYRQSYYRAPVELYGSRLYGSRLGAIPGYYDYRYRPYSGWDYGYRRYAYAYAADPAIVIPRAESLPLENTNPAVNRVSIQVKLPVADAQVWFGGVKTKQTGKVREFVTPPLQSGKRYQYKVRVVWAENGAPQEQTRTIQIQPGQNLTLDFKSE